MSFRVLAFESTDSGGGVALAEGDQLVIERPLEEVRGHARLLVPLAREALEVAGWSLSDLDRVAVDVGPGSYTGIRIGLSIAKSLSLALEVPVAALDRFDLVAEQAPIEGHFVPVLDARRGHVAFAIFERVDGRVRRLSDDLSRSPEDLALRLERLSVPTTLFGTGAEVYRSLFEGDGISFAPAGLLEVGPSTVARVAGQSFLGGRHRLASPDEVDQLVPIYLRLTAAEEKDTAAS